MQPASDTEQITPQHTDAPGAYRRRIVLQAAGLRVFAALEDDFHHMYALIEHDGTRVTSVTGKTLRIPRSSCPGAVARLQEFVDMPLASAARGIDPHLQCTHLFDLARCAMAHALRGARGGRRQYDITVTDRVGDLSFARIARDGRSVLEWTLDKARAVAAPAQFVCDSLFGKVDWKHFDPDTLDAAMLLRRAVWISHGRVPKEVLRAARAKAKSGPMTPTWMPTNLAGACYSFQPDIHASSVPQLESVLDFSDREEELLAELPADGAIPGW
jgi:hypothetical protein